MLLFLVKQLKLVGSGRTSLGSEFHSHVQVFATSCVLIAVCMNLDRSASRTLFPSACALQRLSLFLSNLFPRNSASSDFATQSFIFTLGPKGDVITYVLMFIANDGIVHIVRIG